MSQNNPARPGIAASVKPETIAQAEAAKPNVVNPKAETTILNPPEAQAEPKSDPHAGVGFANGFDLDDAEVRAFIYGVIMSYRARMLNAALAAQHGAMNPHGLNPNIEAEYANLRRANSHIIMADQLIEHLELIGDEPKGTA